jgi:hypothetical protein
LANLELIEGRGRGYRFDACFVEITGDGGGKPPLYIYLMVSIVIFARIIIRRTIAIVPY